MNMPKLGILKLYKEKKVTLGKGIWPMRGIAVLSTTALLLAVTNTLGDSGIFELDGNAVTTTNSTTTHDWDQVHTDAVANNTSTSGASAVSFVHDVTNTTADTEFTGGGSKDVSGIQKGPWLWNSSKPQAKDDIADAFAAAYSVNGHTFLYFGMDRYDNSGDATVGFWFFQDSAVGLNGAKQGAGTHFTGIHTDGDLLLVADFSTGGSNPTINAWRWSGSDASGSLQSIPVPGGTAFAIVNGSTTVAPWAFLDKSGTKINNVGAFLAGELFEGGVDLNMLFSGNVPCFSKFMGETRSSTSASATLSDFSGPTSFPLCGLAISKGCGTPAVTADRAGINYPVNGLVKNTGIGTLYSTRVFDTFTTPSGTQTARTVSNNTTTPAGCDPAGPNCTTSANYGTDTLGAGETGTWSDSVTTKLASTSDSAFAQASLTSGLVPDGKCSLSGAGTTCVVEDGTVISTENLTAGTGGAGSGGIATATCTSSFSTALSVTKNCGVPAGFINTNDPALAGVVLSAASNVVSLTVNVSGQVCNAANAASVVTGVQLTDTPTSGTAKTISIGTLNPGDCVKYVDHYTPSNIDSVVNGVGGAGTGAGRYFFNDLVTISAATADFGSLTTISGGACDKTFGCASASCPICQGSGECTP
jgi:hypothetical protein